VKRPYPRSYGWLAGAVLAACLLCACAPLLLGGAVVGGSLVLTDRRTSGAQVEDETIELRSISRINELLGGRAHVNTTSYNRMVLITGEVPTQADKDTVERIVSRIQNVRAIVNDLGVVGNSSITSRSSDSIITGKVKAQLVNARDLFANSIKVVTERGTVYLMGRVTEREASRASGLARAVGGVQKVVQVFEILTEAELAAMHKKKANGTATKP